ncbi:MAG: RNA polymerase sigma factor [Phycisphaerae bacterium]
MVEWISTAPAASSTGAALNSDTAQDTPAKKLTESELAEKFYQLVWPERANILRFAMFLTHRTTDAEDMTQETLLKAWRALDRFQTRNHNIKAWLLTILRNCWTDSFRRTRHEHNHVALETLIQEPQEPQQSVQPEEDQRRDVEAILNSFSDQRMIDALRTLGENYRWAILLVDVSSLSYEEAAAAMGVPVGTVRSRLFRGRRMVRDFLISGNFSTTKGVE